MPSTSILWRRLDRPGHDSSRLIEDPTGAVLEGTAVFSEAGRPCRLDYRVTCDRNWRTVGARVNGWFGTTAIHIDIAVSAARVWTLNGQLRADVQGCDDIDLSFTPATNLLPIRRTRLAIGARVAVGAAWLRFPDPDLELLDQTYERTAEAQYRYASGGGAFVAILETNSAGFVTQYADLWHAEALV